MTLTRQQILDLLAKEAKQDDVISALGDVATEAKLEQVRLLINSLDGKDFATETKQDDAKGVLDTISTVVSTANFATDDKLELVRLLLAGTLTADISDKPARELGKVDATLTGSTVEVDGVTFQVSGGNTLRGTDAIKPDAVLAHAAIPYCFYFAVDTGAVEATDGTNWQVI